MEEHKSVVKVVLTSLILRRHSVTVDCGSNVASSTQQVSVVPSFFRQDVGTR